MVGRIVFFYDRTAGNPSGFQPYNRTGTTAGGAPALQVGLERRRTRCRRIKHAILPNEPTDFRLELRCNGLCINTLRRNSVEEFGGFVLENEPTGRGY